MTRACLLILIFAALGLAQSDNSELFEKKIRPVLVAKCYACHSSKLKAPMGGLAMDTKAGLRKGGASGPVLVAGKPEESRLLRALRFTDTQLQMPPTGKLPDAVIADFEQWIASGAVDPRADGPATTAAPADTLASHNIDKYRNWWAFQPVRELLPPSIQDSNWVTTKIDSFILAKLEEAKLTPSRPADPRTLIRRATLDLTGVAPTFQEVEAFAKDPSPDAYARLVDRLLASPHYGERWGRYWLDVARYAEDNPTSEATNPPYPYAWRYRDWVIEAVNRDMPYDRFVKLQLAADEMPDAKHEDLRALGYLGAAPVYHKDARLSKDVIETLASDDWDERVDAVSRGLLGLTVACARCHDHKFDPITSKDYYGMAGMFASTSAVQMPIVKLPPALEKKFLWTEQELIHLDYVAKLLTGEPGTKPEEAAQKVVRFKAEIERIKADIDPDLKPYPELKQYIDKFNGIRPPQKKGDAAKAKAAAAKKRNTGPDPNGPFINAVYDAGLWVNGSDPDLTTMDYKPDQPHDLRVFIHGSPSTLGDPAPRRFLTVLAKPGEEPFHGPSGRLEFADRIFMDAEPLAARVIVNRVWAWHFGKPLAGTPSDFGTQGEKPTHPELLDDLSARFIAHGWSLKWLHREIMLSSAYRQDSHPRAEAEQADPTNRLLWRMNPRRMDIEAFRDSILKAAGMLSEDMYGPSADLDANGNTRRTVYAKVSRSRLNTLLRLYDFADPSMHSPGRDLTTTPLQQLFVLNSGFMQDEAKALTIRVESERSQRARVTHLFRLILDRDPSPKEVDLSLSYLAHATLPQFAQALLSTNEFIFWP